ncbi:MAG TPA: helix-turn-helix transcriptional regulator [Syntrophomonas sp.]|nr:helix-turn-helix transcriptional regulator [Syntrophomonas sp.]
MAREKFQTLTEQMFYILLCLQSECYGMDIMEKVRVMTHERVSVGPGTLYNLLESFVKADMIRETKVEGRRRSYLITDTGRQALDAEYQRLTALTVDYRQYVISNKYRRPL